MKYSIIMGCGHEDVVELFGKNKDRERKLEYLKNYGMCKECYKKSLEEKRKKDGLLLNVSIPLGTRKTYVMVDLFFTGDSMTYRDEINLLDYRWNGTKWIKRINFNDIEKEIEKAKSIGAISKIDIDKLIESDVYKEALRQCVDWDNAYKKIESLKVPVEPEIISGYRWNKKIYGKAGNYSIYPDGEKISISDEQADELEKYLSDLERYEKEKGTIKSMAAIGRLV